MSLLLTRSCVLGLFCICLASPACAQFERIDRLLERFETQYGPVSSMDDRSPQARAISEHLGWEEAKLQIKSALLERELSRLEHRMREIDTRLDKEVRQRLREWTVSSLDELERLRQEKTEAAIRVETAKRTAELIEEEAASDTESEVRERELKGIAEELQLAREQLKAVSDARDSLQNAHKRGAATYEQVIAIDPKLIAMKREVATLEAELDIRKLKIKSAHDGDLKRALREVEQATHYLEQIERRLANSDELVYWITKRNALEREAEQLKQQQAEMEAMQSRLGLEREYLRLIRERMDPKLKESPADDEDESTESLEQNATEDGEQSADASDEK